MMQVQEEFVVIKGKRTKRLRPQSLLLETIISNNMMIPSPSSNDVATTTTTTSSSSEHELRDKTELLEDDEDMAYCLILLAQGHGHAHEASTPPSSSKHDDHNDHDHNNKYLFQCKTCDRCFPSFQALGGHRASHNKPNNKLPNNSFVCDLNHDHDHCDPNTTRNTILSLKLTPTSSTSNRPNDFYGTSITSTTTRTTTKSATTKSKSHLCSICGAEFSSGQALGGHMRRHRNFLSTTTSMTGGGNIDNNNIGGTESREAKKPRNSNNVLKLDLNLPAPPEDDDDDDHHHHHQRDQSSKFSFQTNEKVIVFSTASSLVDCHY